MTKTSSTGTYGRIKLSLVALKATLKKFADWPGVPTANSWRPEAMTTP